MAKTQLKPRGQRRQRPLANPRVGKVQKEEVLGDARRAGLGQALYLPRWEPRV